MRNMQYGYIVKELLSNKSVFEMLLSGVSPDVYTWKPAPEKWSLLEVVCHLYDEEREDFRARLQHVLQTPSAPMTAIDPQGWVDARKYGEQDYGKMLELFLQERYHSVEWLRSLKEPAWENVYLHPKLGPMPASLFLHNWLAHDYLHIRQITAIKYHYLKSVSSDTLDYAGSW